MKTPPTTFLTFYYDDEDKLFKFMANKDFTYPSEATMTEMIEVMSKVFLESERLCQANKILSQINEGSNP